MRKQKCQQRLTVSAQNDAWQNIQNLSKTCGLTKKRLQKMSLYTDTTINSISEKHIITLEFQQKQSWHELCFYIRQNYFNQYW